jgi:ectoine hydroxylase-related dioxygenase (phytanoyl-CoA dioxygenase family)
MVARTMPQQIEGEGATAVIDLDAVLAHYAEHGWARLGKLLSDDRIEALRARTDDIMLGRVAYDGLFFQMDTTTGRYEDLGYGHGWEGPSLNYRKVEKLEKDPLFRAWICDPVLEPLARRVYGTDISVYRALLFNKAAETGGSALPWHQDGGNFWGLSEEPRLQVWTALDDAPENGGCIEIVSGSHARGLVTKLGGVVPENFVAAERPEEHATLLPAKAGEVLLIHNHAWHRSARSTTGKPRRGLTVCYMSADTRCLRKKRAPREFFRPWG